MTTRAHILVVDDDRRMVRTLVDILRIDGNHAYPAHSAQEALETLEKEQIDCVLSDISMPGVSGVELCRTIKERNPLLPVILMTAYSNDGMVREGLREGAIAVLPKPLDINAILPFFSSLLRGRSIVIVDDDHAFCATVRKILKKGGFSVTTYTDPLKVLERLDEEIHMVLLGMEPGGTNDLDILREIRDRHPHVTIFVTACRGEMEESIGSALAMGAHTCLYKPLQTEELLRTVTKVYYRDLGRTLPTWKKEE